MTGSTQQMTPDSTVRFRPPSRPPDALERSRVNRIIDRSLTFRSVSVVSAPSGYGKTTAVSDWISTRGAQSWLLLSALDADPARLGRGVIDALTLGYAHLQHSMPVFDEHMDVLSLYSALCDEITSSGIEMNLVVDDAHRAGDHWRLGVLGMLADQPPTGLRLILVGTTLLDTTISRERVLEPEIFIGANDLRFTVDEIERLRPPEHGANARRVLDSSRVFRQTHGWPVAVRSVMLGAQRRNQDATEAAQVPGEQFLGDYVRDHILTALPPGISDFALDTTICAELTPRLAAAVSGRPDAGDLLDECVRLGLFLDRTSSPAGMSYRWHASFRQICSDIRRSDPARTAACHRRAALHLASSDPRASIEHSLHAGAQEQARATLLSQWVTLLTNGNGADVERAASELLSLMPADAELPFVLACATDLLGGHQLAREMMARAENAVAATSERTATADIARLLLCDDPDVLSEATARLRELVTMSNACLLRNRPAMSILLGWSEIRVAARPDLPAEYFASAVRDLAGTDDPQLWVRALGHLAFGQAWAGRLVDAASTVLEIELSDTPMVSTLYASGGACAASGFVAYWAGDVARCIQNFESILNNGAHDPPFIALARMMIAYAVAESGDAVRIRRAAIDVQDIPIETLHGVPGHAFRESAIALVEEAAGNHDRAVRIARKYVLYPNLPILVVAMSGILRRAGASGEALQALRSLRAFSEVSYVKAATLLTAAVSRRHAGDHRAAHHLCEAALSVSSRENLVLLFGHRENAARRLLSEHVHFGTQFEDFVGHCLAASAQGSVVQTLSERERDVFQQLQTSRTLPEIAEVLELSINTVKTHQRAIYRKLGVNSRREAVRLTV